MRQISDVFIIDVAGQIGRRDTKHCVCVSVSSDKYLLINTNHREMYDDFEIKSSDYNFLKGTNRFVCCSKMHRFAPERIIKKVGSLNYDDVVTIADRILNSKVIDKMEKDSVIPELDKWLSDKK